MPLRPPRPSARCGARSLAVLRRVEVDHVRDAVDVDAARGDVGRDERVDLAGLEARERALALALRLVAVHRDGVDAVRAEPLDEPVGAALGAHEDEREVALGVAARPTSASTLRSCVDASRSGARRSAGGVDRSGACSWRARVGRVGRGDAADLALERRREEQRLAVGGQSARRCGRPPGGSPCRASGRPRRGRARGSRRARRRRARSDPRGGPGVATRMCERARVAACLPMPTPP